MIEYTDYLILGNGIAGLNAAIEIRKCDEKAGITILSSERRTSYSRPMLTKAALTGFNPDNFAMYDKAWYDEQQITNLLGVTALELDAGAKTVRTTDGIISYSKCVYALGADCFVPPIPGHDKTGVFTIRNADDIARIRLRLPQTKGVVVIGGGVIGLEAAWELKKMGCEVTVLELAQTLMERLLDEQSARLLERLATEQNIGVHTNVKIDEIFGGSSVSGIRFNGSKTLDAEMVILSCGVRPAMALAKNAGLNTARAVVVNEKMQTSDSDIFACGDCAELNGINNGLWQPAALQGAVAGANAFASRTGSTNRVYEPKPASTLIHAMNTCLFAAGDTGKNPALSYKVKVYDNPRNRKPGFLVNNPLKTSFSYEKYFYAEGRLVGGVLIGDLTKMAMLETDLKGE